LIVEQEEEEVKSVVRLDWYVVAWNAHAALCYVSKSLF